MPGFPIIKGVLLPIILIFLAICSAGAMAYGTHPGLAQYAHGLTTILLARRLQWPLGEVSTLTLMPIVVYSE